MWVFKQIVEDSVNLANKRVIRVLLEDTVRDLERTEYLKFNPDVTQNQINLACSGVATRLEAAYTLENYLLENIVREEE